MWSALIRTRAPAAAVRSAGRVHGTAIAAAARRPAGRTALPSPSCVSAAHRCVRFMSSAQTSAAAVSAPTSTAPASDAAAAAVESNPLLAAPSSAALPLPLFSRVTAADIREGCPRLARQLEEEFRVHEAHLQQRMAAGDAAAPLSWSQVIEPLERILDRFGSVFGVVSHLSSVRDSPDLRAAVDEVEPQRLALSLMFAQSKVVYEALQSLVRRPAEPLSPAHRKILADMLLEAQLGGVGLSDADRATFNALSQRLSKLAHSFSHNVLDATKRFQLTVTERAVVEGIPATARALYAAQARDTAPRIPTATAEDGPWRVGLAATHVVPFLTYSPSRGHRELVHSAYTTRATLQDGLDNAPVIAEILLLKQRLASLLGYASYAHMGLATKLVKQPAQVHAFLEELREVALPLAKDDLAKLREFAVKDGFPAHATLQAHDVAFYSQRLMNATFSLDPEKLRPYFPFPHVLRGLFRLVEQLFDLRIRERDPARVGPGREVDTWHADVKYMDVFRPRADGSEELIAGVYIDAYARPAEKRGGAWMGECVGRALVRDPGAAPHAAPSVRLPVAYLVCNQAPPVDGRPSLMSFDEVTTLFHEMGHVSQHLFTTVDHSFAAGIRSVAWDAVELASQFLENFCYDRRTIHALSSHVDTAAPLPDELYNALIAARNFRSASALLRQLHFASLDMALHAGGLPALTAAEPLVQVAAVPATKDAAQDAEGEMQVQVPASALSAISGGVLALEQSVSARTSVMPHNPASRFLHGFSHIFAGGYAAGYYSYKWAEVMSCDAFEAFDEARADSPSEAEADARWRELGLRYRDTVLALGGSVDAAEVFRMFRGRDPITAPLLKQSGLVAPAKATA